MFQSGNYSKPKSDFVEHNVNEVVNLASQKLKDLITKKQDHVTQLSILKGQKNVLNSDINHYTKEAREKEEQIEKMIEEFNNLGEELIELEKEYAVTLQEYKIKEEENKNTILMVNDEVTKVTDNNSKENNFKKQEIRLEFENYNEIKKENKDLVAEHFNLKRELYLLELQYKDVVLQEELRNNKARKGIDIINKMYYFEYKEEENKGSN